jgi:hypothetical protein
MRILITSGHAERVFATKAQNAAFRICGAFRSTPSQCAYTYHFRLIFQQLRLRYDALAAHQEAVKGDKMTQPSRKKTTTTAAKSGPPRRARRKIRFIAAVRFGNGHRERFSVDNAGDHDEARRMVLDELIDVAAVVISDYH